MSSVTVSPRLVSVVARAARERREKKKAPDVRKHAGGQTTDSERKPS
jgi:hypothetical protein